jgi:hypothetical protein
MADPVVQHHHDYRDVLLRFAKNVRDLRKVQKIGGKGYATPAVGQQAANLEKQVDADLDLILGPTS